jgi:sortase A
MNAGVARGTPVRGAALALGVAALLSGGALLGEQAWLGLKARVAERLIDRAFEASLADGEGRRPWSWADTYPLARLEVPRLGVRRTVLAGATGAVLAFGPGHVDGTAAPNAPGNCVLAGHRDSWFAFLEALRPGDLVRLRGFEGTRSWRVRELAVRSMWDTRIVEPTAETRLSLVTCWPFRGLTRSERRFVVLLTPIDETTPRDARAAPRGVVGKPDQGSSAASRRTYLRRNGCAPGSVRESASTSPDMPSKTSASRSARSSSSVRTRSPSAVSPVSSR